MAHFISLNGSSWMSKWLTFRKAYSSPLNPKKELAAFATCVALVAIIREVLQVLKVFVLRNDMAATTVISHMIKQRSWGEPATFFLYAIIVQWIHFTAGLPQYLYIRFCILSVFYFRYNPYTNNLREEHWLSCWNQTSPFLAQFNFPSWVMKYRNLAKGVVLEMASN